MAYNPGVTDRSGEIFAQQLTRATGTVADAMREVGKRKEESAASDSVMDFIARTNPELLPKGENGQPDPAFLDKFYSGNLKAKQQMLGVLATQMLSPLQKAQANYYNAQTDLMKPAPSTGTAPAGGSGTWGKWGAIMGGGGTAGGDAALPTADPLQAPAAPTVTPMGLPGIPGGMQVPTMMGPPTEWLPPLSGPGAVAPMSPANRAALTPAPPMGI